MSFSCLPLDATSCGDYGIWCDDSSGAEEFLIVVGENHGLPWDFAESDINVGQTVGSLDLFFSKQKREKGTMN